MTVGLRRVPATLGDELDRIGSTRARLVRYVRNRPIQAPRDVLVRVVERQRDDLPEVGRALEILHLDLLGADAAAAQDAGHVLVEDTRVPEEWHSVGPIGEELPEHVSAQAHSGREATARMRQKPNVHHLRPAVRRRTDSARSVGEGWNVCGPTIVEAPRRWPGMEVPTC